MQSYSVTITCSIVASLTPNGLLTLKRYKLYNKIQIKFYFVKLQTRFSQYLFFTGCHIFPQVLVICLHLIKHVPLRFNTLVPPPVCILRAKLWKVVMKCKIAMLLTFVPFFQKKLHFWDCDILSPPTVIKSTESPIQSNLQPESNPISEEMESNR